LPTLRLGHIDAPPDDGAIFDERAKMMRCCTSCGLGWLISAKRRKENGHGA